MINYPFNPNAMGPLIGVSMRDACTRAMAVAMDMRFSAVAHEKGAKPDGRTDWLTQADLACQRIFVKLLNEQWVRPFGIGLIGEEEGLNVPCRRDDFNAYFTIDPIDGTSAYARKESSGFGPMIALVFNGRVVAVCVGDANSGELYYFRPGSQKTHRLVSLGARKQAVELSVSPERTPSWDYLLLRRLPGEHSATAQRLIGSELFPRASVAHGSIGLSMARLWKGEVGACLLRQDAVTPWDDTPVAGMSDRLGYDFWELREDGRLVKLPPDELFVRDTIDFPQSRELLVIHRNRFEDLHAWIHERGLTLDAVWPKL